MTDASLHAQPAPTARPHASSLPLAALNAPAAALGAVWTVCTYAVVATSFGALDPFTGAVRSEWNPIDWELTTFSETIGAIAGGELWGATSRTLLTAVTVLVACGAVGLPVAAWAARQTAGRRRVVLALLVVPLVVGTTVRTVALAGMFGNGGVVERAADALGVAAGRDWLGGHLSTVVIAAVTLVLPLFTALAVIAFSRVDEAMYDMARDLGAGRNAAVWRVALPAARPGIVAAFMAASVAVLGDFSTSRMLSITAVERDPVPPELLAGELQRAVGAADVRVFSSLALVLLLVAGVGAVLRLRSAQRLHGGVA